jgi:hypothetical protein
MLGWLSPGSVALGQDAWDLYIQIGMSHTSYSKTVSKPWKNKVRVAVSINLDAVSECPPASTPAQ